MAWRRGLQHVDHVPGKRIPAHGHDPGRHLRTDHRRHTGGNADRRRDERARRRRLSQLRFLPGSRNRWAHRNGGIATNGVAGTPQSIAGTTELVGVACPVATTCHVVGTNALATGVIVTITDGTAGSARPVAGTSILSGVACPTITRCETVGSHATGGIVIPVTNGVPGAAQGVAGTNQLNVVACPTRTRCEAVGGSGSIGGAVRLDLSVEPPPTTTTTSGAAPTTRAVTTTTAQHTRTSTAAVSALPATPSAGLPVTGNETAKALVRSAIAIVAALALLRLCRSST